MRKVLLVALGSTARADCLAEAIGESLDTDLYSFMQSANPAVIRRSKEHKLGKVDDFNSIKEFASKVKPDLAVISPDYAIAIGVADELLSLEIPVFAPR
ncbi:MAG: phosphoribosylamine--glycine ligase, partial [Candidatus Micrarchaeota archaeon]